MKEQIVDPDWPLPSALLNPIGAHAGLGKTHDSKQLNALYYQVVVRKLPALSFWEWLMTGYPRRRLVSRSPSRPDRNLTVKGSENLEQAKRIVSWLSYWSERLTIKSRSPPWWCGTSISAGLTNFWVICSTELQSRIKMAERNPIGLCMCPLGA